MRMSKLFSQTLREAPSEADSPGYQLLLRAGFIRQIAAGVFSLLPLGRRTQNRIESILHEEMQAIGGQEICMPVVQPAELWKATGRWEKIDAEMGRMKDRNGRDMALAMTHEEVTADLARREIHSYRDLPRLVYHIQTKWRDDPRPRAGLIRAREFVMKDSYSLDATIEGLETQYQAHYETYFRIFKRCGLDVIAVGSDVGMMGGSQAHEFMYLNPTGEDTLMICPTCGYAANRQIARARKSPLTTTSLEPIAKVFTPDCKSIASLANYLGIPQSGTAKAVFLMAEILEQGGKRDVFVFAVVRGDMEVNETKVANVLGARTLRPATEEEIRGIGAEPGYASPVGLEHNSKIKILVDESVAESGGLVAGANEAGYHLLNVTCGRDYTADLVADITAAQAGDGCMSCGSPLEAQRGIEVGNIFKLGTHFSETLGAKFLDRDGMEKPVIMGSYGIGVGRLLACIAEEHRDEKGLMWPESVAPYLVHIVLLAGKNSDTAEKLTTQAEMLYKQLKSAGFEALFDDRFESPGIKFNDADLIGLPFRLTVSERAMLQGGVELKLRANDERVILPQDRVIEELKSRLKGQTDQ